MTFSIGPMPTVNVSKTDNSSHAAFFQGRPENESGSFGEIFKDTLKSRGRSDIKTAAAENKKAELVRKAEINQKINNINDPEPVNVGDENPEAEKDVSVKGVNNENEIVDEVTAEDETDRDLDVDDTDDVDAAVKELLMKLEELNTGGENQALLESIKELLQKLVEIQTEISGEAAAGICAKVSGLENVPSNIRDAIITVFEKPGGTNTAESAEVQKDNIPIEGFVSEKNPEKEASTEIVGEKNNIRDDSITRPDNDESRMTDAKTTSLKRPSVPEQKGDKADTAVKEDNTEAAIEAKIEKVTVEDNTDRGQETGKNNSRKEAAQETNEAFKTPHNKSDVDGPAVMQEQNIASNKAETVQNQSEMPKAQPVGKIEIINQIVKKAEVILTGTQSEMQMQLEPENLGKLTLRIAVEKGLITAKFTAESYEVKQVIESNFNELRDMLQEKGLDIQNLSVSVGHESKEFNFSNNNETWKDKLRPGGKNMRHGTYGGYQDEIGTAVINPYNIHTGRFDQRA